MYGGFSFGSGEKKLGAGPKTRTCYICGRQYGLSSIEIHIKQCRELWIAREALLPRKEKRPIPIDPNAGGASGRRSEGQVGPHDIIHGTRGTRNDADLELDEVNRLAGEAFNTTALSACEHCGRTFLNEKLPIHNRSCTRQNPGRRVGQHR